MSAHSQLGLWHPALPGTPASMVILTTPTIRDTPLVAMDQMDVMGMPLKEQTKILRENNTPILPGASGRPCHFTRPTRCKAHVGTIPEQAKHPLVGWGGPTKPCRLTLHMEHRNRPRCHQVGKVTLRMPRQAPLQDKARRPHVVVRDCILPQLL